MDGNPQQGEGSDIASTEGDGDRPRAVGAVEAVLAASDHYAVLGASRSAERGQLCRSYVETSVQVHPAGNSHPDAEQAFLRATAAWAELCSADSRARYDAELQKDMIMLRFRDEQVTMSEARGVFAQAWNECLCGEVGNNMTEFAYVLSRAQQLMSADGGDTAGTPLKAAASGLALSFGLWAAGAAASAGGFGTIGALARRAALVQGAGQVAMGGLAAYQQPELREAIDSGVAAVAEPVLACASGARAAARGCAGKVAATCQAPNPFALGSLWEQLPPCLPRLHTGAQGGESDSDSSDSDGTTNERGRIRKRDVVCVHGLRSAVDLNGRSGVVSGFDKKSGRFMVRILPTDGEADGLEGEVGGPQGAEPSPKEIKLIKKENLIRSKNKAPLVAEKFI